METDAVVSDTQPEFRGFDVLEPPNIAFTRFQVAGQCVKNTQGNWLIDGTQLSPGRIGPENCLLHCYRFVLSGAGGVRLIRANSSGVRPNSASTFSWGVPSPRSREARAAAISRASSSETGSSSTGAFTRLRATGSVITSSRRTTAEIWLGTSLSINSCACSFSFAGAIKNSLPTTGMDLHKISWGFPAWTQDTKPRIILRFCWNQSQMSTLTAPTMEARIG